MMQELFELAVKSLLVAALGLGLLRLTRRRSAAERSLIAHLVLVALVALPLARVVLPPLPLPVLPAPVAPMTTVVSPVLAPATRPETAGPTVVGREKAGPAVRAASPSPTEASAVPAPARAFDWTPYAYAAPAVGLLLLTLFALLRLFALSRRAEVLVEPVWLSALAHAQRRMGLRSGTALLVSDALPSPISWGWARPVIVLDRRALAATGEAEAIIAHELAHVVALDWAKLMLARVATALYWFNPLVWMLAREAHQLREEAADDAVLATAIPEVDYAQLLVGVARHEADGLLLGAHGVAPGRDSLRRRVGRVLDSSLARRPAGGTWLAGFGTGMLVMTAPLAALTVATGTAVPTATPAAPRAASVSPGRFPAAPTARIALAEAAGDGFTATSTTTPDGHTTVRRSDGTRVTISAPDRRGRLWIVTRHADGTTVRTTTRSAIDGRMAETPQPANRSTPAPGADEAPADDLLAAAPWLAPLSADDVAQLRAMGVTPDYVRELVATGLVRPSRESLIEARAVGLRGSYVRAMVEAGYRGGINRLLQMREVGIGPADLAGRGTGASAVPPDTPTVLPGPSG